MFFKTQIPQTQLLYHHSHFDFVFNQTLWAQVELKLDAQEKRKGFRDPEKREGELNHHFIARAIEEAFARLKRAAEQITRPQAKKMCDSIVTRARDCIKLKGEALVGR